MALVWQDGCDYYGSDPGTIWTAANGADVDLTGLNSRTGIGAIGCQGITAPQQSIPTYTVYFAGCGAKLQNLNFGGAPLVFKSGGNLQVELVVTSTGAVAIVDQFATRATSIGGLVQSEVYSYFELGIVMNGASGTATARVNGVEVLTNIAFTTNAATTVNTFTFVGQGGGLTMWVDDIYVCDDTGTHNNTFLGPVRLYPTVPNADLVPLDWTPSTGTAHFSLVNSIPPPGGATYVQAGNFDDIDQYQFPLPSGIGPVLIKGFKVQLNAELDAAGARSVGVQMAASVSPAGQALNATYHGYSFEYDVNPNTGVPLLETDFPLSIGPVVTA